MARLAVLVNHTGRTFGSWKVLARAPNVGPTTRWFCRCKCGAEHVVRADHLVAGRSTRCRDCGNRTPKKHGCAHRGRHTGAYQSWRAMWRRVRSKAPKDRKYRGVKVAKEWTNFETFLADMGERPPGRSLDRFPARNGRYGPDNCRWATMKQQVDHLPQNNRSTLQ